MGAKLDVEGRLVHASAADRAAEKLARCMVSIEFERQPKEFGMVVV